MEAKSGVMSSVLAGAMSHEEGEGDREWWEDEGGGGLGGERRGGEGGGCCAGSSSKLRRTGPADGFRANN